MLPRCYRPSYSVSATHRPPAKTVDFKSYELKKFASTRSSPLPKPRSYYSLGAGHFQDHRYSTFNQSPLENINPANLSNKEPPMQLELNINSTTEMQEIGAILANHSSKGDIICLFG